TGPGFMGGSGEVGAVAVAVADAEAGTPHVALVAGDPGIGKSRLVAEVAARAQSRLANMLLGRAIDLAGGELPFGAWVDAFRGLEPALAGLDAGQTAADLFLGSATGSRRGRDVDPAADRTL